MTTAKQDDGADEPEQITAQQAFELVPGVEFTEPQLSQAAKNAVRERVDSKRRIIKVLDISYVDGGVRYRYRRDAHIQTEGGAIAEARKLLWSLSKEGAISGAKPQVIAADPRKTWGGPMNPVVKTTVSTEAAVWLYETAEILGVDEETLLRQIVHRMATILQNCSDAHIRRTLLGWM